MRNIKLIILLLMVFSLENQMYSQVGNLMKKVKDATKKETEAPAVKDDKAEKATPAEVKKTF
jgi:hypothetical protein